MQACCRVVTTKISNLTAMPLVPVSLVFQHNSPPRQNLKFIFRKKEKSNIRAKYTCVQNGGVMKRWLMHTAPPFCKEKKSLEPNHSVGFSQDPAFYSYKMVPPTPWGEFQGGYLWYLWMNSIYCDFPHLCERLPQGLSLRFCTWPWNCFQQQDANLYRW